MRGACVCRGLDERARRGRMPPLGRLRRRSPTGRVLPRSTGPVDVHSAASCTRGRSTARRPTRPEPSIAGRPTRCGPNPPQHGYDAATIKPSGRGCEYPHDRNPRVSGCHHRDPRHLGLLTTAADDARAAAFPVVVGGAAVRATPPSYRNSAHGRQDPARPHRRPRPRRTPARTADARLAQLADELVPHAANWPNDNGPSSAWRSTSGRGRASTAKDSTTPPPPSSGR
jgi:hypothetical protein